MLTYYFSVYNCNSPTFAITRNQKYLVILTVHLSHSAPRKPLLHTHRPHTQLPFPEQIVYNKKKKKQ